MAIGSIPGFAWRYRHGSKSYPSEPEKWGRPRNGSGARSRLTDQIPVTTAGALTPITQMRRFSFGCFPRQISQVPTYRSCLSFHSRSSSAKVVWSRIWRLRRPPCATYPKKEFPVRRGLALGVRAIHGPQHFSQGQVLGRARQQITARRAAARFHEPALLSPVRISSRNFRGSSAGARYPRYGPVRGVAATPRSRSASRAIVGFREIACRPVVILGQAAGAPQMPTGGYPPGGYATATRRTSGSTNSTPSPAPRVRA